MLQDYNGDTKDDQSKSNLAFPGIQCSSDSWEPQRLRQWQQWPHGPAT